METLTSLLMVTILGFLYKGPAGTAGFSSRENLYQVHKNHALIGHTIVSRFRLSKIRCSVLCLRHSQCVSFNHDNTSGSCQINDAKKEDFPESFQQVVGSSYLECLDVQPITKSQAEVSTTAPIIAHSFETVAMNPPTYTFILEPMTVPLRLNFEVRTARDALVALALNATTESIFADIVIGGFDTTKSVIRACFTLCPELLGGTAEHTEAGLLSDAESRPFWIEYKEGVVTVGKGGEEGPFLEWDAGAYHGRVPSKVVVGISSWENTAGYWIVYN